MQDLRSFKDFLRNIKTEYDESRFYVNGDYVYYLPEGCILDKSIHYIRTGLLMGRLRNGRFEPSQALAMNLKACEWKNPLLLDLHDDRVMRYLKGETVIVNREEFPLLVKKGYVVISVDGYNLGFGKITSDGSIKNLYPKAWRLV